MKQTPQFAYFHLTEITYYRVEILKIYYKFLKNHCSCCIIFLLIFYIISVKKNTADFLKAYAIEIRSKSRRNQPVKKGI